MAMGRRLVWKWVEAPRDPNGPRPAAMTIAWTLIPKDGGTLLVLEHIEAENLSCLDR